MPPRRSTPKTLHRASELREEPTPAERNLWSYLRLMRTRSGSHKALEDVVISGTESFPATLSPEAAGLQPSAKFDGELRME
jgi:hypothetical protein